MIHWFFIHTGTYNESGPYYGFWSGFGSDLGEITLVSVVIAGFTGAIHHVNCGHKGCWRVFRHTTKNGHRLCKKHIAWSNDDLVLHEIHEDHR